MAMTLTELTRRLEILERRFEQIDAWVHARLQEEADERKLP